MDPVQYKSLWCSVASSLLRCIVFSGKNFSRIFFLQLCESFTFRPRWSRGRIHDLDVDVPSSVPRRVKIFCIIVVSYVFGEEVDGELKGGGASSAPFCVLIGLKRRVRAAHGRLVKLKPASIK
jgi:hypothetical protein